MLIGDIGEFELIGLLESSIRDRNTRQIDLLRKHGIEVEIGIGDDAAAWRYPVLTVVSTTDTMVEGVHFKIGSIGWRDLGWKAMASNLSDVAAMGCSPSFAMVTLGLPPSLPVDGLTTMYAGMMDACEHCGGALIGGDVVRSDAFFVTIALEGFAEGAEPLLRRSAALPGQQIAVTGSLGGSAAGLKLILDPMSGVAGGSVERKSLVAAHNRPVPRVAAGRGLRAAGVRCAMDVSDGLVADLGKLCTASGVSAVVDLESVPVSDSVRTVFPDTWQELALTGGEDYELLFAADREILEVASEELEGPVTTVGRIEDGDGGVTVLDSEGKPVQIGSGGWDHFGG